jgi:hypothetical protein
MGFPVSDSRREALRVKLCEGEGQRANRGMRCEGVAVWKGVVYSSLS